MIGTINFQAPDEGTGSDAILVAAGIEAVSEGDFSSSNNATKLSFKTASSEAASEKMSLSSAGNLNVTGTITCATSFTIGNAAMSETDLEKLDGITDGTAAANKALVLNSDKDVTGIRNLGASGTITGNVIGDLTGNADTATTLKTARDIGGVSFDGSASINLPGVNASGTQDTSGNAATATALETARNIGGVSFNGIANINLPGVNTAGNQDTSGNAATATSATTYNSNYSSTTKYYICWNINCFNC